MKKRSMAKIMALILASTIIVSALNLITVSAATTDVLREVNFDTVLKSSITPTSIAGYSTDLKNNGTTTAPLNLVSLAANPVTNDSADKTLKLTSGTGNPGAVFRIDGGGTYGDIFPDGNVNVIEVSVLRNDHRATQAFEIYDSAYKKIYPVLIDAAGKVEMKDSAGTFVVKTDTALALNTWHTFTFVLDMTGADKYLTLFVNGNRIDSLKLDPTVTNIVSSEYNLAAVKGIWLSTGKSGPTVNTYFNDVRFYTAKSASLNIASPLNGDKYLYGSTMNLNANAYMGSNSKAIKKVEFYVNDKLVGEKTTAPFNINYKPLFSGSYILTAKAYDEDNTIISSSPVSFTVSPSIYKETEVIKNDFESYTGGAPVASAIGETWSVSKLNDVIVDGYYTAGQVDSVHVTSLVMKSGTDITNTEIYMNLPWNKKPTGAFHLTGEFLYNDVKHQRLNLILQQNADTGRVKVECIPFEFSSAGAVQSFGGATKYINAFVDDKWYKIDVIGEVSNGTLTINAYIDGKLYAENLQYPNWVQADRIYVTKQGQGGVSDGYVTVDNFALYTLDTRQTVESVGIYKGTSQITSMSQLTGGDTVTLKADIAPYLEGDNKYSLVLATYNNGVLDDISINDYNGIDKFETSVTLPEVIDNYNVKGFLWNGFGEITPLAQVINLKTTP